MARRKFKFVEMFIDPSTGVPFENTGSPKIITPKNFPPFLGHQIARIQYEEKKVKNATYTIKNGKAVKGKEEEITILIETMGEKGGWIEQVSNLSQDGKCWVGANGIVCGNGFICDNVNLSSGEVGENAKVAGDAQIGGQAAVGGNAYVFGKASITGSERIAVTDTARVCGKVEGEGIVSGNAYVGEKGVVGGKATVYGNAVVYGKVEGNASVCDAATVYGTVKGNAQVSYEAFILEGATVEGDALVQSGVVGGTVKGSVVIDYGQPIITEQATVEGKTKISGNVYIGGTVKGSPEMSGNVVALKGAEVNGGKLSGNGTVKGKAEKSDISGGAWVSGKVSDGADLSDGARVGPWGKASKAKFKGSANVGGTASDAMSDNSVVVEEAKLDQSLVNNMVFLETGEGSSGQTAGGSVICKVETGDETEDE